MQFQLKKASEKRIFYQKQHREILLGRQVATKKRKFILFGFLLHQITENRHCEQNPQNSAHDESEDEKQQFTNNLLLFLQVRLPRYFLCNSHVL